LRRFKFAKCLIKTYNLKLKNEISKNVKINAALESKMYTEIGRIGLHIFIDCTLLRVNCQRDVWRRKKEIQLNQPSDQKIV